MAAGKVRVMLEGEKQKDAGRKPGPFRATLPHAPFLKEPFIPLFSFLVGLSYPWELTSTSLMTGLPPPLPAPELGARQRADWQPWPEGKEGSEA